MTRITLRTRPTTGPAPPAACCLPACPRAKNGTRSRRVSTHRRAARRLLPKYTRFLERVLAYACHSAAQNKHLRRGGLAPREVHTVYLHGSERGVGPSRTECSIFGDIAASQALSSSLHASVNGGVKALSLEQALRGRAGPLDGPHNRRCTATRHAQHRYRIQIRACARASPMSCTRSCADARVHGHGAGRHGASGRARRSHGGGRAEAAFEGCHRWDALSCIWDGYQPNLQRCPLFITSGRPLAVGLLGARASAKAHTRAISGVCGILLSRLSRGHGAVARTRPMDSHPRVAQRAPWN